MKPQAIDIKSVAEAARPLALSICRRLMPEGRLVGSEWTALNPRRSDRHLGSFRINISSGKWADFATNDHGGDLVSLIAYLDGVNQREAARRIAQMIGYPNG